MQQRLAVRTQLTTDGHKPYLNAVEDAFGGNIDYAMLIKIFDDVTDKCIGTTIKRIAGSPDRDHISTSYVEKGRISQCAWVCAGSLG